MNSLLISVFVLITTLMTFIESEDFCVSFRQNDDRISHMYTRFFEGNHKTETKSFITINDIYWKTKFVQKNPPELTFLDPNQGIAAQILSDKYLIAVQIKDVTGFNGQAFLYLIDNKSWTVMVAEIPNDDSKVFKELSDYRLKTQMTLKGVSGSPVSAFQTDDKTVVFVYQTDDNLRADGFRLSFENSTVQLKATPQEVPELTKLKEFKTDSTVLSVISQYSDGKNGYIILIARKAYLLWCWTQSDFSDKNCINDIQLLIDCTHVPTPPKPTTTTTVPPKASAFEWMPIAAIGFVLIWIVIIISIIVYIRNKNESQEYFLTGAGSKTPKGSLKKSPTLSKTVSSVKGSPTKTSPKI